MCVCILCCAPDVSPSRYASRPPLKTKMGEKVVGGGCFGCPSKREETRKIEPTFFLPMRSELWVNDLVDVIFRICLYLGGWNGGSDRGGRACKRKHQQQQQKQQQWWQFFGVVCEDRPEAA